MDKMKLAMREIKKMMPELELRRNEPMSAHCSFRIGGPVSAMAFPKSAEECEYLAQLLAGFEIEPLVMGNGTNLLVCDDPLDIFVIKTCGGMSGAELLDETTIRAEAGITLSRLAVFARSHGLSGLEFAHGIPGSLGGAVSMNAGAYGGEMKAVVRSVRFLDSDAELFEFSGEELGFEYRKSVFSDTDSIILDAVIELERGEPEEIDARMLELAEKRRASQPLELPSAGSTFKRPANGYAAALIDSCGLKGFRIGGAMISEKHAGFVVNAGGASFDDVIAVMEHAADTVYRMTGTELEPEVKIIM